MNSGKESGKAPRYRNRRSNAQSPKGGGKVKKPRRREPVSQPSESVKIVVRRLPPALNEKEFLDKIRENVEVFKTILQSYYVEGSYPDNQFDAPVNSRCYLLLKDEKSTLECVKYIGTLQFVNSQEEEVKEEPENGDELKSAVQNQLVKERNREIYEPVIERAMYYQMPLQNRNKKSPMDGTIVRTKLYKTFLRYLDEKTVKSLNQTLRYMGVSPKETIIIKGDNTDHEKKDRKVVKGEKGKKFRRKNKKVRKENTEKTERKDTESRVKKDKKKKKLKKKEEGDKAASSAEKENVKTPDKKERRPRKPKVRSKNSEQRSAEKPGKEQPRISDIAGTGVGESTSRQKMKPSRNLKKEDAETDQRLKRRSWPRKVLKKPAENA